MMTIFLESLNLMLASFFRNAYIMTAIYGKNFCWSAKESFFLLLRNAAR